MNESELEKTLNELKSDMAKYNFVYSRSEGFSVEESLKMAGRSKGWFYGLPKNEQERLESVACELNADNTTKVKLILDAAKVKAAEVKTAGLNSRDERIKQSVATEILDRTIGKAASPIELQGKGGEVLKIIVEHSNSQNNAPRISCGAAGDR